MIKPILIHPDKQLETVSLAVDPWSVDAQAVLDLKALVDDLYDTVRAVQGAAIAAIQIGVPVRVMVLNVSTPRVLVNPSTYIFQGQPTKEDEGCLSVPGITGKVYRWDEVEVTYHTLTGETKKTELYGLEARAFQHEYEHLDGQLFLRHLNPAQRKQATRAMREIYRKAARHHSTPFEQAYYGPLHPDAVYLA